MTNVVHLIQRPEQKGNAVEIDRRVSIREPATGECSTLQLADPHFAQHLAVVAHDSARVELDGDPPVRALTDLLGTSAHLAHPTGTIRRHRGNLDFDGLCRRVSAHEQRQGH